VDLNRRRFLGATLAAASGLRAQPRVPGRPPRVRTGPLLCLNSSLLPEIEYSQLGTILNGLGFDGCDLSVEAGGTVLPEQSPVDLVRAIEVITGSMLEVPLITTSFLSIAEPWARNVLALSARSGAAYFRSGYSKAGSESMAQHRSDIAGLMLYGRAAGIGIVLPYPAGEPVVRALDSQWAGYEYEPSQAGLETVLPLLRVINLRDSRRENDALVACPLGEGTIDWPAFFAALARARFSGPLCLTLDYKPAHRYKSADRLEAIQRDLAFARRQLNTAYQKEAERV
jgi:L-ribulose-5-phosphate 3-epimerase